ncbi:hypothetical protein KY289_030624 [Solanum tuberosum]|nr:hypothetical protein KY289_030624 [Solanum tuberosum]
MSSNNREGPSLHTGGSVAFAEYRRRHINQFIKERGAPSHQEVSKSIFSLHFPETVNRKH